MFLENLVLCICKGYIVPFPLVKIFVYENQCYTNAHVLCFLLIVFQWFNEIDDPCNGPKDYKFALLPISCIYNNYVYKFCPKVVWTLTLVISYLIEIWIHVHVTIGLFEVHKTIGLYVARKL